MNLKNIPHLFLACFSVLATANLCAQISDYEIKKPSSETDLTQLNEWISEESNEISADANWENGSSSVKTGSSFPNYIAVFGEISGSETFILSGSSTIGSTRGVYFAQEHDSSHYITTGKGASVNFHIGYRTTEAKTIQPLQTLVINESTHTQTFYVATKKSVTTTFLRSAYADGVWVAAINGDLVFGNISLEGHETGSDMSAKFRADSGKTITIDGSFKNNVYKNIALEFVGGGTLLVSGTYLGGTDQSLNYLQASDGIVNFNSLASTNSTWGGGLIAGGGVDTFGGTSEVLKYGKILISNSEQISDSIDMNFKGRGTLQLASGVKETLSALKVDGIENVIKLGSDAILTFENSVATSFEANSLLRIDDFVLGENGVLFLGELSDISSIVFAGNLPAVMTEITSSLISENENYAFYADFADQNYFLLESVIPEPAECAFVLGILSLALVLRRKKLG